MEKFNVPKPCLQVGFLSVVWEAIVAFKIKSLGNFVTSAHEKLTLNRTDIRNETCKIPPMPSIFLLRVIKKGIFLI